jgi:chemotaxis protein methyltransferase CheR
MMDTGITDQEFSRFQRFIHEAAGIRLTSAKKALVSSRLMKRLHARSLPSYGAYYELLASGADPLEVQTAVDLLTTNETYFFREPRHFDFLRRMLEARTAQTGAFRAWSAASSSGEEAYSIAMVLDDLLGARPWEILGSDLSAQMLARAQTAHYVEARATHIPPEYRRRYCLKGVGPQAGTLLVARALRSRVRFRQINLTRPLPQVGVFDVIFLRNVMIYFDDATKRAVVTRLLDALAPGGHLLIGHAETVARLVEGIEMVAPSIYRKPA